MGGCNFSEMTQLIKPWWEARIPAWGSELSVKVLPRSSKTTVSPLCLFSCCLKLDKKPFPRTWCSQLLTWCHSSLRRCSWCSGVCCWAPEQWSLHYPGWLTLPHWRWFYLEPNNERIKAQWNKGTSLPPPQKPTPKPIRANFPFFAIYDISDYLKSSGKWEQSEWRRGAYQEHEWVEGA